MTRPSPHPENGHPIEAVIYSTRALEAQAHAIAAEAIARDLEAAGIPARHTRDWAINRRQLETTMRAKEAAALAAGGDSE